MSATLFFLAPIGLMTVVWSLCFVGCFPPTTGGYSEPYSNIILSTETSMVAYWPLSDVLGSQLPKLFPPPPQGSTSIAAAADLSGNGHIGSYLIPPAYPPGSTIPQVADPTPVAGQANTGLLLHQTSIVPGDAATTGSLNLPACVDFEGGYVSIPWASDSPSLADFTLEAWVLPKWKVSQMGFKWTVFAGQTTGTGFAVYLNTANEWELTIGNGTSLQTVKTGVAAVADDGVFSLTYIAVRFNSSKNELTLWVNPDTDPSATATPVWPNASSPQPSGLTYAAVDPAANSVTFFIGAGSPQLAPRTLPTVNGNSAPQAPFQGWIQSVALYYTALSDTAIASHFSAGIGSDT